MIIFKLNGIELPKGEELIHNGVSFLNIGHERLENFRTFLKARAQDMEGYFTLKDNETICLIPVKSVTTAAAIVLATDKVQESVAYFQQILGHGINIERGNVFDSTDMVKFGFRLSGYKGTYHVSDWDLRRLRDNAYSFFDGRNCRSKEQFLNLENKYVQARNNNHMGMLWSYLEGLLKGKKFREIIRYVSRALLLDEMDLHKEWISSYLQNIIHIVNSSAADLGITLEEQERYIKNPETLGKLAEIVPSELFKQVYNEMNSWERKLSSLPAIYGDQLLEAYDIRNQLEHGSNYNERSMIKMRNTFPLLVNRFRSTLFRYMENQPILDLVEILAAIEADCSELLDRQTA